VANLSLKDLVSRYNDANEKAKKRRAAWEERRRKEEAEEAKRLKKLEGDRFNLLGEVVSQTGFTERYQVDGGTANFPLLIGIILDGMDKLEKDDGAYDLYLKKYEAFATKQEAEIANAEEETEEG